MAFQAWGMIAAVRPMSTSYVGRAPRLRQFASVTNVQRDRRGATDAYLAVRSEWREDHICSPVRFVALQRNQKASCFIWLLSYCIALVVVFARSHSWTDLHRPAQRHRTPSSCNPPAQNTSAHHHSDLDRWLTDAALHCSKICSLRCSPVSCTDQCAVEQEQPRSTVPIRNTSEEEGSSELEFLYPALMSSIEQSASGVRSRRAAISTNEARAVGWRIVICQDPRFCKLRPLLVPHTTISVTTTTHWQQQAPRREASSSPLANFRGPSSSI